MKFSFYASIIGFSFSVLLFSCSIKKSAENAGEGMEDPKARLEWEMRMLADPATGKIPDDIRAKEIAFASTLPKQYQTGLHKDDYSIWRSRGPWNLGGRTRAIAIDVTNENIIFAAGVSGGIWRSVNGGQSWSKITRPDQLANVTCIVQDTRKDKTNIWYAGTGELLGNSASGNNAFFLGDGILKSIDGGNTWNSLPSTTSGKPQSLSKDFNLVRNIVINTADTGDILYAATYGSIYKSVDGGAKWSEVRGGVGFNAPSVYTNIAISPKGIVYAVLSSDGDHKGIWRCADGKTWIKINPTGFAAVYNQMEIGIDPNNENTVYILGSTPNYGKKSLDFRKREDWASFWKYTYISGDGNGSGGNWEDLSQNLPAAGGHFGNFNTQGGYNIYVRVKPGDSKTIYLGSTNLWRSTDGFKTTNNISWIGGYAVNTTFPGYELYPNQHPDQHNLVFYPSNPNKMIAACDGGIFRTADNMAQNVVWEDVNKGYITSQFYTVAIDHATPFNDEILGGLQDNGTYFTRSTSRTADWTAPGDGDGSYCAITDGRTDYYVSKQQGKIYHVKIDEYGKTVKWGRIDPLGSKNGQFINPFVLDPNNQKRMYFVGDRRIWQNDDVTQLPMYDKIDTNQVSTGWKYLASQKDTSLEVTTLAVSRKPADRLYYATMSGKLWRVDNASTSTIAAKNITGSSFPAGYINNICIDPENADRVLVVFSNYNVQSLFYTTNGGTSWVAVGGNLEQFATGTGNGPSCRWAAILPVKDKRAFFIATSAGLFSTDTLKGANTVWTLQSPDGIGHSICTMIDSRPSDGLVVVATHGSGMYSSNVNYTYQVTRIKKQPELSISDVKIYPNPMQQSGNISFWLQDDETVNIDILDERGRLVKNVCNRRFTKGENNFSFNSNEMAKGLYYCRLQMSGNVITKAVIVQ